MSDSSSSGGEREKDLARLAHVSDLAGVAWFEVDADRNIVAMSPALERLTGFRADEVLGRAEGFLAEREVSVRTGVVQARAAGAAIVDEAVEWGADLLVMGLRYKKRFGGAWDAGRTVPYVMRNSTAPVWCLRVETEDLARTP